jgi:predicted  nucleic acid-binding Zn-ribbon protein
LESRLTSIQKKLSKTQENLAAYSKELADRQIEVEKLTLLKVQHEDQIVELASKLARKEQALLDMSTGVANSETRPTIVSFITSTHQTLFSRRLARPCVDADLCIKDEREVNVTPVASQGSEDDTPRVTGVMQVTDAEVQAGAMQWEVKNAEVHCALQLQSVQELSDREREVENLSLLKAQHEVRIADLEGKLDSTQQELLKMEDSLAIRSQELADIQCEVELLSLHKEQYEVQIAGLDTVSSLGARAEADELRKELEKTKKVAGNQESLVQERDAALERANAAEEQIKMWVEKSETLERTWEEWRCRVDEMQQDKEQDQRELSKMKNQEALIPVAVALTIEADYDELLSDVDSAVDFNVSLQTDVQLALGVAKSSVQVLCHRRGSIIAEIVLRRSDDGQGNSFTPQQLATQLQALAARQDGPLQQLPVGKLVKTVEIHGPIPEALVVAVSSAMQDALEVNLRGNMEAHLSLENKSNALQTALHDVEELMDILISQKSYAEALSDPSLLQDEAISWLDVNHRQFLAQLHYDAEQLGESFFTAISELEKVVERLQSLLYHRMAHRTSTAAQSPVIAFLPASVRVKAASTTNSDASVHRQHTSSSLENLEELESELELELLKCRQDIADLFDCNLKNKIKLDLRQSQHMPEAEDQITPIH